MCRRALSVCAVTQSSGFEWTSACCVRYTHLSSYNPSLMAACMRHVNKHNLTPAARPVQDVTSPLPRATDAFDRRENYRRERVREARALRGSRRRSAPAEARRMCDDSFHIIMSRATQPGMHGREPDRARDTARPSTRPRCYTIHGKTPCLHSHAYLLVHFSAKMPFT